MKARPLILASTSVYRAGLLSRLGVSFTTQAPGVEETPLPRESSRSLASRLALAKACAISSAHPQAWVLGSDQAAFCGNRLLGKPGTREAAIEQLSFLSGREARFATAVALSCRSAKLTYTALDITVVRLRRLTRATVERYLEREPALDCAGSFKCEGLGIVLFSEIRSRDPTALVGLPLIQTAELLRRAGFELP